MAGFVRKLLGLKDGEAVLALRLGIFVFLCHSIQASGKVLQYSIFLSEYGRGSIAQAFFLSALVVAAVSLGFAGLVRGVHRRRLLAGTLLAVALVGVIWRIFLQRVPWSGFAVYLIVEAASLLAVVIAWNVVNSLCDPRQARRVIPVVGLGASGAFLVNGLVISPLVHKGLAPRDVVWFVVVAALGACATYLGFGLDDETSKDRRVAETGRNGGRRFVSEVGRGLRSLWGIDLLRVFTVATVLMIVAQQFLNFAFLSALQRRYDAEGLATFLGWFVALLGLFQGIAQAVISGRVLSRLGGTTVAALVPGMLAFGGLVYVFFLPSFWALVGLRFVDRVFKTAFYSPAVQSLYTPVARQTKLAAMTLIKGVVSPAAYGTAAVGLMVFSRWMDSTHVVLLVSLSAGACALWLGLLAKRAYVSALESALTRGAFSFDSVAVEGFGVKADKTVIDVCRKAVRRGNARQAVFALRLLGDAPSSLIGPVVKEALSSPHVLVRRQAAELILEQRFSSVPHLSELLLGDADGEVVAIGLRLVDDRSDAFVSVTEKLTDPRPLVRACAGLRILDWSGRSALPGPDAVRTGRSALPGPDAVRSGRSDSRQTLTAARDVIDSLARSEGVGDRVDLCRAMTLMGTDVASDLLEELLSDESWAVRGAAAQAVGRLGCVQFGSLVVGCLRDRRSRAEAVEALALLGPDVFVPIERVVADGDTPEDQVEAVTSVLGRRPERRAAELLWRLMRHSSSAVRIRAARALWRRQDRPLAHEIELLVLADVREGFRQAGVRQGLLDQGLTPEVFLQELDYQMRQTARRLVATIGLFFPRDAAEKIWSNLERGATRHKAGALELIEQLCPRHLVAGVVPLIEGLGHPLATDVPEMAARAYETARANPIETACGFSSVELKWFLCYELPGRVRCCREMFGAEGGEQMRSLIEKMLFLKGVGMFSALGSEELRRVAEIADEVSLPSGRTIFRRGDPGDAMYLVLDGVVEIVVDGRTVAELGGGECFGEMALLDAEPRSADARSATDVDLIKIRGEDFDELLAQKHEIARGILRVLSTRLRRANVGVGPAENPDVDRDASVPS